MRILTLILLLAVPFTASAQKIIGEEIELDSVVVSKQLVYPVKDKLTADALPAKIYLGKDFAYDELKKEATIKVHELSGKASWRLVHDKVKVIYFDYTKGVTVSIYEIIEGTYAECLDQIKTLNLEIDDETKQAADLLNKRLTADVRK